MVTISDKRFLIEDSLGFLLSKCHQKTFQAFREKLAPYGLTPPQFGTLAFLWQKDGLSQIQLGAAMDSDRTTVSGIIDRLEAQDLVSRLPHPEDRRIFSIYLTEKGRDLEKVLPQLASLACMEASARLSEKEQSDLCILLKKMWSDAL